jgi:hypothetical protein
VSGSSGADPPARWSFRTAQPSSFSCIPWRSSYFWAICSLSWASSSSIWGSVAWW